MIFNSYPYEDFHEMNLDWVIKKLKEMDAHIDELHDQILEEAVAATKEYVDTELSGFLAEFADLKSDFIALTNSFNSLNADFITLKNDTKNKLNTLEQDIINAVIGVNQRTDLLLQDMYDRIFSDLSTQLSQIKVINYFTGEQVTVQDMFNYLAMLHLNDSIDYDTMALRAKTYTQLAALNITFTNLAMHGNTLYV